MNIRLRRVHWDAGMNDASNLYCQGCGSNPGDPHPDFPLYCTRTCRVQVYPARTDPDAPSLKRDETQ